MLAPKSIFTWSLRYAGSLSDNESLTLAQTCIATPGEDNEIEVVTSTQNPTKAQT